jgi:hypothetical protein
MTRQVFFSEMSAIQPITGRFKSRVFRDIIGSTILGTFFGYIWWYGFHVPAFKKFTEYNSQILQEIKKENAEFLASLAQVTEAEATEEPAVSVDSK